MPATTPRRRRATTSAGAATATVDPCARPAGPAPSSRTAARRPGPWRPPGTTTAAPTSNAVGRQRAQQRQLPGGGLPDGLRPGRDPPARHRRRRRRRAARSARPATPTVRDRGQVPAAEPADLALHAALLVRALDAGHGRRTSRTRSAQRSAMNRAFSSRSRPSSTRTTAGLEVVVADHPGRHPTEVLERPHVPVQERLLGLVGDTRRAPPCPSATAAARTSTASPRIPAITALELAEVDLGLRARLMGLRHRSPTAVQARARPAARRTIRAHRRLRHPAPCSSTSRCQTRRAVCRCLRGASRSATSQPRTVASHGPSAGRDPRRRLPRRRHRVGQRLPHRPPVHPMPRSQLPDRQPLVPAVTSDTFELLHSRSPPSSPSLLRDRLGRRPGT